MANFNVDIGTRPLANKMDSISANVQTVNMSIGAMTRKLVDAEAAAAENVSSNVTYGFYIMTRNQFLQKAISLENEVTTLMMQIQTWSRNLNQIQQRMEKDYHMISRQYLKTFNNLDRQLKQGVHELDQPLLEVVQTGREKLTERRVDNAIKCATYPSDMLPVSEAMVLGKLKLKGKALQEKLWGLLNAGHILNEKMAKNLSMESVGSEGRTVYFPVVLSETESLDMKGSGMMEIHMPAFPEGFSTQKGSVYSSVVDMSDDDVWTEGGSPASGMVRSEFQKLIASLPERKREIMMKLISDSSWQELKE